MQKGTLSKKHFKKNILNLMRGGEWEREERERERNSNFDEELEAYARLESYAVWCGVVV